MSLGLGQGPRFVASVHSFLTRLLAKIKLAGVWQGLVPLASALGVQLGLSSYAML